MSVDFVSNYDFFENVGFGQCSSYIATNISLVYAEFCGKYGVFAVCYDADEVLNTLPYCLCPYYSYAHFAVLVVKSCEKILYCRKKLRTLQRVTSVTAYKDTNKPRGTQFNTKQNQSKRTMKAAKLTIGFREWSKLPDFVEMINE